MDPGRRHRLRREVLRYGVGGRYALVRTPTLRLASTLEFVGWEVLGGRERGQPAVGPPTTESAAGTSILNLKVGYRVDWRDRLGLYAGYGHPLTGERWYSDVFRVEVRVLY